MTRTGAHKYRPFTIRDGLEVCAECYEYRNTEEHRIGEVSIEFVSAVEDVCGIEHGAWDMIDPRKIILAAAMLAPNFIPHLLTKEL